MGAPIPDGPLVATYCPNGAYFGYYSHPTTTIVPDGFPMPEISCAPPHSQPFVNLHQFPEPLPTQIQQQVAMSPSVSSRDETPSALGSPWSVPECEEMDGYSYQGSPLDGVPYKQGSPVAWSSPAQGPNSPSPWQSPVQVFRQVDEGFQQQGFQQHVCPPVSGPAQVQNGMYSQTSHPFTQDANPTSPGIPMSATTSAPALAPATSAPAQGPVELEDKSSSAEAVDGDDTDIRHQPYSKQLVQALLSHPRRAMTVQQIYKWFEENTDRHESSGWQNSIRHNLSLNKVRPPSLPPSPSISFQNERKKILTIEKGIHHATTALLRRRLPPVRKQDCQARKRVGPRALRRKGRPQHRKVPPQGLPLAHRPPPQVLRHGARQALLGPQGRLRHEPHEEAAQPRRGDGVMDTDTCNFSKCCGCARICYGRV